MRGRGRGPFTSPPGRVTIERIRTANLDPGGTGTPMAMDLSSARRRHAPAWRDAGARKPGGTDRCVSGRRRATCCAGPANAVDSCFANASNRRALDSEGQGLREAPRPLQAAGRAAEGDMKRETLLPARSVVATELGVKGRGCGGPALHKAPPASAATHNGSPADIARGLLGGMTPMQALCVSAGSNPQSLAGAA